MSTPTTTQAAIRAALITRIEAINPTHGEYQDYTWTHLDQIDPRGLDLRLFRVLTDVGSYTEGGVFGGDGMEADCEVRIRVAYGGLDGNELTDLVTRDGQDLWVAVHDSPGGSAQDIPGLIRFEEFLLPEPVDESIDEETNTLVIDWVTRVYYKAAY